MIPLPDDGRTLIIAEIGSNHLGDPGLAHAGIAAAKEAGADVVKFQMYRAEELVDDQMPVLKYIAQTHKTQRERFQSLQLPPSLFEDQARAAEDAGLVYMVTPFYDDAVAFLDPLMPAFKIASGDLTNLGLIRAAVATGKPVFLSTGLSNLDEIDRAVAEIPKRQLHLLHCVGAYPTPDDQVSLNTIPFLAERYGVPVGFSDHSIGTTACVAAVALGATCIEKHFMPDLDVPVADFRAMVDDIRRVETMRGAAGKTVQPGEEYFLGTLRRSVYTRTDVPAGAALRPEWLISLRPWLPEAVSPMDIDNIVGQRARRPIRAGSPVLTADLK